MIKTFQNLEQFLLRASSASALDDLDDCLRQWGLHRRNRLFKEFVVGCSRLRDGGENNFQGAQQLINDPGRKSPSAPSKAAINVLVQNEAHTPIHVRSCAL